MVETVLIKNFQPSVVLSGAWQEIRGGCGRNSRICTNRRMERYGECATIIEHNGEVFFSFTYIHTCIAAGMCLRSLSPKVGEGTTYSLVGRFAHQYQFTIPTPTCMSSIDARQQPTPKICTGYRVGLLLILVNAPIMINLRYWESALRGFQVLEDPACWEDSWRAEERLMFILDCVIRGNNFLSYDV